MRRRIRAAGRGSRLVVAEHPTAQHVRSMKLPPFHAPLYFKAPRSFHDDPAAMIRWRSRVTLTVCPMHGVGGQRVRRETEQPIGEAGAVDNLTVHAARCRGPHRTESSDQETGERVRTREEMPKFWGERTHLNSNFSPRNFVWPTVLARKYRSRR